MLRRVALAHIFLRSVLWLFVTANVVRSSPILVTLMMEAILSSKTSVPTLGTGRQIPEDDIFVTAYGLCQLTEKKRKYSGEAHGKVDEIKYMKMIICMLKCTSFEEEGVELRKLI
jgi:hypothetical protein